MYINQYYGNWSQGSQLYFYCNGEYTWNSPSVDMSGNYLPFFNQYDVFEIPQDTQFTIEITNNSEFDHYDAGALRIDFNGQFFDLYQIMDQSDPYSVYPDSSWTYTCTLPQSVSPIGFGLVPPSSSQGVDVTIRVVFPEIFTGWLTAQNGGMYQYDSSSSEWTSY